VGAEVERTDVDPGGLAGDCEAVRGLLVIVDAEAAGGAEATGAGGREREERERKGKQKVSESRGDERTRPRDSRTDWVRASTVDEDIFRAGSDDPSS